MSELGERIRRERKRRGERQIDAAERFGVSQATMFRWEVGENRPEVDKFAAVAEYLGLKVDEVYHLAMEAPIPTSLTNLQAEFDALRRIVEERGTELADIRRRLDQLERSRNGAAAH